MRDTSLAGRPVRARAFIGLAILLGVRTVVLPLGIDRLTTVSWTTPVTVSLALTMGVLASLLAAREAFVLRRRAREIAHAGETGRIGAPLKEIAAVTILGIGVFFLVGMLLGVVAQHLPGRTYLRYATVESTLQNYSGRNPCKLRVVARSGEQVGSWKCCVETVDGVAIGPAELGSGDAISMRLRDTPLGTVVESATRAR
jgi:hypothetical protein